MTEFLATKRVGSVLRSDQPLTWVQAGKVLDLLAGELGRQIDTQLLDQTSKFFGEDARIVDEQEVHSEGQASHLARGQIFHSRRVSVSNEGFQLLLSISFTVCVKLDVPYLDQPAKASQSKFWFSAIVSGKPPGNGAHDDAAFANVCEKIDQLSPRVLENVRPIYGEAVRAVNPQVSEIERTGDGFSTVVFQVQDLNFRAELEAIERGEKRLRDTQPATALGLLNQLYSGRNARYYLHVGRKERESGCLSGDVSIDTFLHQTQLRARAFVIETRDKSDRGSANWRCLGVTSATEPVARSSKAANGVIYQLVHSPANVLSAEMAAEIGEQF